jgi:hypothetical protein
MDDAHFFKFLYIEIGTKRSNSVRIKKCFFFFKVQISKYQCAAIAVLYSDLRPISDCCSVRGKKKSKKTNVALRMPRVGDDKMVHSWHFRRSRRSRSF